MALNADIAADVTTIATSLAAAAAAIRRPTASDTQLADAQQQLQAMRSLAATLIATLDTHDPLHDVPFFDPAAYMLRWEWVTQTRRDVGDAVRLAIELDALLGALLRSRTRRLTHIVRSGDTLQGIALRWLGTHERWVEIADANGLDYGAALTSGAEIVIPGQAGTLAETTTDAVDIVLPEPGSDEAIGTTASGDLATHSGLASFRATFLRGLATSPGDVHHHPEWGVGAERALSLPLLRAREDLLRRIKRFCGADRRIVDVAVTITSPAAEPDRLDITAAVQTVDQQSADIRTLIYVGG